MSRNTIRSMLAIGMLTVTGCANYQSVDGVESLWRDLPADTFEANITTQADVMAALGPPSQLIDLKDQVVFYYLARKRDGKAQILLVWNSVREINQYDRAIFFFDRNGILQSHAYSRREDGS